MKKIDAINRCKGKQRYTAEEMIKFADFLIEDNPNLTYGYDIFFLELMPREMGIKRYFTDQYGFKLENIPKFKWLFAYKVRTNGQVEQKFFYVNNLKELEYKIIDLLCE